MVLKVDASSADGKEASPRRLKVRSPQALQPAPAPPAVIQCGLTFMPDSLGPGHAGTFVGAGS